jgi:disulfide bond formation protein DsbB
VTETVNLFLGILTLLVAATDVVIAVLALAARWRRNEWARRTLGSIAELFGPQAVLLAAIVAVTAMSGSLYYSEVAGYVPCELCWFQRIGMYASAVILVVAAIRREIAVRPYALTLAGLGAVISAYHVAVQRIPEVTSVACTVDAPCTAIWVNTFGFISIPVMAGVAFCTIIVALLLARPGEEEPIHVD